MAPISLRRRFSSRTFTPFAIIACIMCVSIWVMDYFTQRNYTLAVLDQRLQTLEVSLSAYLDRADFEVKYLAGQVSQDKSIDDLFQLHDVLFFGGLDFFYVTLADDSTMEDPRVRLYTRDNLSTLVQSSRLDTWQHISSSDQGELLVMKKALQTDENDRSKGFFYGFISLNNNLALASDLINSAEADLIRISTMSGKPLLQEAHTDFSDDQNYIRHERIFSLPNVADKLSVEVRYARSVAEIFSSNVLVGVSVILILFAVLFYIIQLCAQRIMFLPISGLPALGRAEDMNFQEFQPLLNQMNRFQVMLKSRDQHLELLSNALQSAIIFCDESSRVTMMNEEARELFPDYQEAKTVFDMTPITCHQPIQRALKGEFAGGFELEFSDQQKVYDFNTYTFVNENGFRSVMLVGRNVTEVRRLRWHLTHRFPMQALDRPQPAPSLILQEMEQEIPALEQAPQATVRWLTAIGELLSNISQKQTGQYEELPLGQLVMALQTELEEQIIPGEQQRNFIVELPLDAAQMVGQWSDDHKVLLKVAFLLCMSSSISGRYVDIAWERNGIAIKIYGARDASPALEWLRNETPKLVKGRSELSHGGRVTMTSALNSIDSEVTLAADIHGKRAVLIKNDYADSERAARILSSINVFVDVFTSFAEFFGSSTAYRRKYDAIFVGLGDEELAVSGVNKLIASSPNEELPLVYLSEERPEGLSGEVVLKHQMTDYSIALQVLHATQFVPVSLGDWATQATNFIVTGGSDMSQIIWQSELNANGFVARREENVSNLVSVLRHHGSVIILILDKETAKQALKEHLVSLVNTKWLVLEDFPERPDTMPLFDIGGQLPSDVALDQMLDRLDIKG